MGSEEFDSLFQKDFDNRGKSGEPPGSADLSTIEIKSLRKLLSTSKDKEEAREIIIQHGFPLLKYEIGPEDLSETAYKHLCVVASWLNKERGQENAPDTVESYITKNCFDRWVQMRLVKNGKFEEDIGNEWLSPQNREHGYSNKKQVQYPKGVDDTKIYGVAKPNRYLPSQLIRYLEYARLGKITDKDERVKLGLKTGEEDKYKIEWSNYKAVVDSAETVDDIASGIAVRAMVKMKENGLADEQIANIIIAGYNPAGVMNEHGDITEIHGILSKVINKALNVEKLKNIGNRLIADVDKKMKSRNPAYEFKYNSEM